MAISIPAQSRALPPLDGNHRWWALKSAARCTKRVETTSKKKLFISTNSNSKSRHASSYSSQLRKSFGTKNTRRNTNRHGSQKATPAGGQFCKTQKSSSSALIVDHAEYPITASYGSLGGQLHYSAPVKHRVTGRVVVALPDPFRGMGARRNSAETQQSGHTPRSGP